jgi:hypothetical protein
MDVNKIILPQSTGVNRSLNIPVQLNWDYLGLDQSIELYEEQVITEVIGIGRDFEVTRFANESYSAGTSFGKTEINYEFYFYSGGSLSASTNWQMNYVNQGFSVNDVYYYNNNFSNSFFKLDFYDSKDEKSQVNYLTVILPTQQGMKMDASMQGTPVSIRKPKFILDYIGDVEGFFIYWLKKREFLDIDTFYMTAKFYNAKIGNFVKLMNQGQFNLVSNPYTFDATVYFYYPVKLDYEKQKYVIYDQNLQRIGDSTNPIKWYEYVNPPLI